MNLRLKRVFFGCLGGIFLWMIAVLIVFRDGVMLRTNRTVPGIQMRNFTLMPNSSFRPWHGDTIKDTWRMHNHPPLKESTTMIFPDLKHHKHSNQRMQSPLSQPTVTSGPSENPAISLNHHSDSVQTTSKTTNYGNATSYLLSLSFEEQLSAATHNMLTLAPLAADWNAQLVEPTVARSQLFGIRGVFPPDLKFLSGIQDDSINLSELYDYPKLLNMIHAAVSPNVTMVKFEQFIASAPKEVTLLHFNTFAQGIHFTPKPMEVYLIQDRFKNKGSVVIDCTGMNSLNTLARVVESHLNKFSQQYNRVQQIAKFAVKKILCLDTTHIYRSRQILDNIPSPATIIFTGWRGCGVTNCSLHHRKNSGLERNPNNFRFVILTENVLGDLSRVRIGHNLHHPSIIKIAQRYLETIGIRPPFLSIHIRTERLLKDGSNMGYPQAYYSCCLRKLATVVNDSRSRRLLPHTVLITDAGSGYGTDTCGMGPRCTKDGLANLLSAIQELNFTITSYDPTVLRSTRNSAYVSLVEMSMLSLGERLVMVGRGGFQANLKAKFLALNHGEGDVHHLCSSFVDKHGLNSQSVCRLTPMCTLDCPT